MCCHVPYNLRCARCPGTTLVRGLVVTLIKHDDEEGECFGKEYLNMNQDTHLESQQTSSVSLLMLF